MLHQPDRWRRLLSILFLVNWTLTGLSACVTSQGSKARQGLIWEASRGQQKITLVGTMHVGVSPDEIPKGLWTRLDEADTVVTEVDLVGMNGTLMRRYLILPESQSLDQLMGSKDWAQFKATIHEAFPQIGETQLKRMSPLAACSNLMLAEAQLAQKSMGEAASKQESVRDQVSMDQFIIEKAKEKGKKLQTFETLEEQFGFLDQVFTLDQLRDMLKESSENRAYYKQLASSFKEGDAETIDAMVATMPAPLREILLDQRNQNWGKKLQAVISPQKTFIAVGAAHLGGSKGLLNILEAQGFQLRPLKLAEPAIN